MPEQYHQRSPHRPSTRRRPTSPPKVDRIVRTVLIILAIMAIAAGCGGKTGQTSATTATTTNATPTTTAPGPSVQQVASKVAGLRATDQKLLQDFKDMCDLATWTDESVDAQAFACSLVVQRAPLEGQIAVKTLTIANPPAEVAALLVSTRASAAALAKVSAKQCTKAAQSDGCVMVETTLAKRAAENFQIALASWEPYL